MNIYYYNLNTVNPTIYSFLNNIGTKNNINIVEPARILYNIQKDLKTNYKNINTIRHSNFKNMLRLNTGENIVITNLIDSLETFQVAKLKKEETFKFICFYNPLFPFMYRSDRDRIARRSYSFQKIDHIVTFSEQSKKTIELEHTPSDKISVILPGLDVPEKSVDKSIKSNIGFKKNDFVLSYFGNFEYNHLLYSLIDMYKNLVDKNNNVKLFFIGQGAGFRNLRDITLHFGIRDSVVFHEKNSNSDISELIDISDVVIFGPEWINSNYGYDLKIIESKIKKKLVILSNDLLLKGNLSISSINYYNDFRIVKDAIRNYMQNNKSKETTFLSHEYQREFEPSLQTKQFDDLCIQLIRKKEDKPIFHKKFSVIIPIYNRANIISRALNSIYNQKRIDLNQVEIICIDDGSDDNIKEVIKQYHNIKYIRIAHTGRVGLVRNAGLIFAQGEIITYLDSDDRWEPKHLYYILKTFKYNYDLSMVFTGHKFEYLKLDHNYKYYAIPNKSIHKQKNIITNAVAHKKKCIDIVGNFPDSEFAEDYYLWMKIRENFPCKKIPHKTAVFSFIEKGNHVSYSKFEHLKKKYY